MNVELRTWNEERLQVADSIPSSSFFALTS